MVSVNKEKNVKEDLLNSAGELFAERGFEGASIRDIIRIAGATLSSVNYYFGSKENLYLETIRFVLTEKINLPLLFKEYIDGNFLSKQDISNNLYKIIRNLSFAFLSPQNVSWYGKFLARTMLESNPDANRLLLDIIYPVLIEFERKLASQLPQAPSSTIELFCAGLFGQIHHYTIAKNLIIMAKDMPDYTPEFVEGVIQQIALNMILPLGLPSPAFGS